MKKLLTVLLLALTLEAISNVADAAKPTTQPPPTTETSPGVYKSDKYGYTVTVPADWKRVTSKEQSPVVLCVTADDGTDGKAATVARVEYRPKISGKLDAIAPNLQKAVAEGDPKATLSSIGSGKLGGVWARQFTVVKSVKGVATRIRVLLTVKSGHLYIFTLENDAGAKPMTDTIESTFQFTN